MTMFGEVGTGPRVPGGVWRFLGTFGFVMLCGIVGPIFLVAYFLIDAPDTGWMLWTGLAITILDVLLGVGLGLLAARSGALSARLRTSGRMAVADVTSIRQTSMLINDEPVMVLGLHIHGEDIVDFDVEKRTIVPTVAQALLHARRLVVLVDPATEKFEIDWDATALLAGSVPARFTSSEDGRTYDLTGRAEPLAEVLRLLHDRGIGMSANIDLRSNPAVREEVMAVVRRYAGTARGGGHASGGPVADTPDVGGRTPAQRLVELKELLATGAISQDEYARARERIIGSV